MLQSKDFANDVAYYLDTVQLTLIIQKTAKDKPNVINASMNEVISSLDGDILGADKPFDQTGKLFEVQLQEQFCDEYGSLELTETKMLEKSITFTDFNLPYYKNYVTFQVTLHPFSLMEDTFCLKHAEDAVFDSIFSYVRRNYSKKFFTVERVEHLLEKAIEATYSHSSRTQYIGKHYILRQDSLSKVFGKLVEYLDFIDELLKAPHERNV